MSRLLSPAAARHVFLTLTVTRWFPVGLVVGILTLWPLERGLTVPEALSASSLAGFTVFLLELPTSGFADAFGRRPVYLTAAAVGIASAVVFFTATAWWQFALAAVLTGMFRALDSGPLEAWFVDTVTLGAAAAAEMAVGAAAPTEKPGQPSSSAADVDGALSAQGAVLGVSIASGALISGGLVWWHPIASQSGLLLPGLLYIGLTLAHLVAVALLLEETPRQHRREHGERPASARSRALDSVRAAPSVITGGLRLLGTNRVLAGLVAVEIFWGMAMVVFETFQPIRLAELLGSEERAGAIVGPVASGGWALFALGSGLAGLASRRIGVTRTAILARALNGIGAVVMGLAAGPVGLIAAYAATYTLHGGAGPMHAALLHREASAHNRATVLSMNSMVSFLAYSMALTLGGVLAGVTSTATAMVVLGAVSVLGALCYLPALAAERSRPREQPTAVPAAHVV
jgi:MFS family permease